MSTLEPHIQGMVVPRHIGRRIIECMEEKGKTFTQHALAIRIGMNKQTLSKKLRGERDLYMFELRRIAEALHVQVERLMKSDTADDERKLTYFLENCENLNTALEIAQSLSSKAIGATERSIALNDLGRAFYLLGRYDEAHTTWLSAYETSKKIAEKYSDRSQTHQILSNLLISYTVREDYSNAKTILEEVEAAFIDEPVKMGATYYTRAKMEEHNGNIQMAKQFAYESLRFMEKTGDPHRTARAKVTVAHYEFTCENYKESANLLEQATNLLRPYKSDWLSSVKEYAKSLLKTGDYKTAQVIITSALQSVNTYTETDQYRDILSKLRLLLSVCTDDYSEAESVLNDSRVGNNVRYLAYRLLYLRCIEHQDNASLMKYAIIGEGLGIYKTDILVEEWF